MRFKFHHFLGNTKAEESINLAINCNSSLMGDWIMMMCLFTVLILKLMSV